MEAGMFYGKKRQCDTLDIDHCDSTEGRVRIIQRVDALAKLPHREMNTLVFVPKLDILQSPGVSFAGLVISIVGGRSGKGMSYLASVVFPDGA